MTSSIFTRRLVMALLVILSAVSLYVVTMRLKLDPNVASLLPERGESAALRRYLRAFGGSDLAMVLVKAGATPKDGDDADALAREVKEVADGLAGDLSALSAVQVAAAGFDAEPHLEPMLVWRNADVPARERLKNALEPAAMRSRLSTSRDMLLAPGAGAAAERIAKDPLRLSQLLYETRETGSGFRTQADGTFANDDGTARLVLVFRAGQSLRGDDAQAFVKQARGVLADYEERYPRLRTGLTGGHAIAEATERMLNADLKFSGTLSMLLASLAFLLTFRRLRALIAVMPPLMLGTLWTAGIAASWPDGLSAIAVAFMSVVIGVGVDTGVHVYAALVEARQEGLDPKAAARRARRKTQKPVLVAALTAGAAFAALSLSEIAALRQLGILCAGGEILTAIAIVVVTPEIGALLEKGKPPKYEPPRWTAVASWFTRTRSRAAVSLAVMAVPAVLLFAGYAPEIADAVIAMRPKNLEPLNVQQEIYDTFGGRSGQWVLLTADADREKARERADRVADALSRVSSHMESIDTLTAIAPAPSTQRSRFAERDALDMPAKSAELERALTDVGFAPERFTKVLEEMKNPPADLIPIEDLEPDGVSSIMLSRYLGEDGGDAIVVQYLLPKLGEDSAAHVAAIEEAIRSADPETYITGYGRLERSLKQSLLTDMPRIGLVAGFLVLLALAFALRRTRDVVLAGGVVLAEIGIVLFAIRIFDVPLHAYDALVLPVLLGITVDEGMFLLFRARETGDQIDETLRREGPPVATTALTTAAGFGGLILCDFDGLQHLGMVGAIGSVSGLIVALIVGPAGIRLVAAKTS
jgi:predicted RND superfamily exporter protein